MVYSVERRHIRNGIRSNENKRKIFGAENFALLFLEVALWTLPLPLLG
jgi:hypothetical protein